MEDNECEPEESRCIRLARREHFIKLKTPRPQTPPPKTLLQRPTTPERPRKSPMPPQYRLTKSNTSTPGVNLSPLFEQWYRENPQTWNMEWEDMKSKILSELSANSQVSTTGPSNSMLEIPNSALTKDSITGHQHNTQTDEEDRMQQTQSNNSTRQGHLLPPPFSFGKSSDSASMNVQRVSKSKLKTLAKKASQLFTVSSVKNTAPTPQNQSSTSWIEPIETQAHIILEEAKKESQKGKFLYFAATDASKFVLTNDSSAGSYNGVSLATGGVQGLPPKFMGVGTLPEKGQQEEKGGMLYFLSEEQVMGLLPFEKVDVEKTGRSIMQIWGAKTQMFGSNTQERWLDHSGRGFFELNLHLAAIEVLGPGHAVGNVAAIFWG